MRARPVVLLLCLLVAGCGGSGKKTTTTRTQGPPVLSKPAPKAEHKQAAQDLGFPGFATKNTTRVGGADPVADAAGVALAVFPSAASDARPDAVSVVDAGNWQSAISAAQLMAGPVGAPVLFSDGGDLPAASRDALKTLKPNGARKLGGAEVVRIGDDAATPDGLKAEAVAGSKPAEIAAGIDLLQGRAAGRRTRQVIVAPSAAPSYAMPAAALAAKTGAPVLWAGKDQLPRETVRAIRRRKAPKVYVIGPSKAISSNVVKALGRLGPVKRIHGADPAANAVAVARFSDGSFGWNVVDPGHGLVFANADRTGDAAAAAPLSASGSHGPLLLFTEGKAIPSSLQSYLLDIQPGYDQDPVRGVYNHGWLLGDAKAISGPVQSRLDTLLEIQPVSGDQ